MTAQTLEERQAKLDALRKKRAQSTTENRQAVIKETTSQKVHARAIARLERKKKQAEALGEKERAAETGEDLERKRNWDYSIEDNERWDAKQARKAERADVGLTDFSEIGRKKYEKDLDFVKPVVEQYRKERASKSDTELFRDGRSFVYADHKPSEEAIDRLVQKMNVDTHKKSKKSRLRKESEDDDVTYINEANKNFNKKLDRFYNTYTKDIRDNFERGTAL